MAQRELASYRDKLAQTNREAKATAAALAVIVAVWLVGGFGLAGFDVQLFGKMCIRDRDLREDAE